MQTPEACSASLTAQLGRLLRGRYRIDALIGTGCMGAVFHAWDNERERACAIKLLLPDVTLREAYGVRFLDEAQMITRLCHPNIVEIWDHGEEADGTLYFVMELLKGRNLHSLLKAQRSLPLEQTLDIIKQVGSALHMVHLSGIVHRDVKPQNIILLPDGDNAERYRVKIIDFGLAKLLEHKVSKRGSDGMLIGTPIYLPPEAWSGVSADVDARADQWALGVLTYLMLSGYLPYEQEKSDSLSWALQVHRMPPRRLRELLPRVPNHVDCAVARALSREKEQRFPNISDFVHALHDLPRPANPDVVTPKLVTREISREPRPSSRALSGLPTAPQPILETLVVKGTLSSEKTVPPRTAYAAPVSKLEQTLTERIVRRRWKSPYLLPAISAFAAIISWTGALFVRIERPPRPVLPSLSEPCVAAQRSALIRPGPAASAALQK